MSRALETLLADVERHLDEVSAYNHRHTLTAAIRRADALGAAKKSLADALVLVQARRVA